MLSPTLSLTGTTSPGSWSGPWSICRSARATTRLAMSSTGMATLVSRGYIRLAAAVPSNPVTARSWPIRSRSWLELSSDRIFLRALASSTSSISA